MEKLEKHCSILFNRKSGKILKCIESYSCALLKMYALQNKISATRDYVVFNIETGEIKFYCEGKGDYFPTFCEDMEGKNVYDLCKGLKEELMKDTM